MSWIEFFAFFLLLSLNTCPSNASKQQVNEFTKGISSFAWDFYQQCSEVSPENMIISPFSTAMALSLFMQGTNGRTFEELKNGLHLDEMDKATIADQFKRYHGLVKRSAGESEIMVANRIYVQQRYHLKPDFQRLASKKFFSGVESVDFMEANDTANTINQFVAKSTKGRIKEIVEPDMFDEYSRIFLVNVIYLKSAWAQPFSRRDSSSGYFWTSETEAVLVHTMSMYKDLWMANLDDLNASALRLDYANSSLSFIILLPNSRTGELNAFESQLNDYDFTTIIDRMVFGKCLVTIPKFKVETTLNLNEILKKMGMITMFDKRANLSGLLDSPGHLFVQEVMHKTIIEINEEHTEVSSVTGGRYGRTKSRKIYEREFCADHSFVYYIWDRESNTTIFSGHFTNFGLKTTKRFIGWCFH